MEISNQTFDKYVEYRQRQNYLDQETKIENKRKKENGVETGDVFAQQEINKLKAQLETGFDPSVLSE
jgi:ribosome assembly protein YihI (activator of Der GTPase)